MAFTGKKQIELMTYPIKRYLHEHLKIWSLPTSKKKLLRNNKNKKGVERGEKNFMGKRGGLFQKRFRCCFFFLYSTHSFKAKKKERLSNPKSEKKNYIFFKLFFFFLKTNARGGLSIINDGPRVTQNFFFSFLFFYLKPLKEKKNTLFIIIFSRGLKVNQA